MIDQVVILGAGRPHRGLIPSALRTDRVGATVLDWLLDALEVGVGDVTFVGGYGVDSVRARYPSLKVIVPEGWEHGGAARSFLAAPLEAGTGALVVYSDVMVRPAIVAGVRRTAGDVVVALDSRWRERFAGRRREVLEGREKVIAVGGRLVRLGPDVALDDASGEFVGLVRLTPAAVDMVQTERDGLLAALHERAHLSELVEAMRAMGLTVGAADASGDWAEVDEPADIARFVLGTKADTLARLGRIVTSSQVVEQVTRTVAEWQSDPAAAVEEVAHRFGDRALIVRSSTTHEDAFAGSNAGGFTSVLGVRAGAPLVAAVGRVIAAYREAGIDADPQQVLVQPLVEDVVASGVALTRTLDTGAPWLVVEYSVSADTEAVTSGASGDLRTLIVRRASTGAPVDLHGPTLDGRPRAAQQELDRMRPVLAALSEVEELLGHDALDVEFAVDAAGIVHLLQVRPAVTATGAPRQDGRYAAAVEEAKRAWEAHAQAPEHLPGNARLVLGVMPDWNPAEILGTAPARLATDLYRRLVMDEVWAIQRMQVGYRDVRPAPLLVDLAGRPYVDVRASLASFLPATLDSGLAGRFLTAGLERLIANPELHDKVEFAIVPTCVGPGWDRWRRLLTGEGFDATDVAELREGLAAVTVRILRRVDRDLEAVNQLVAATAARTGGVEDPLERAALLLDETVRLGTLPFAHLARAAFVAVSLLRGAHEVGVLSDEGIEGFHAGIRTVSQQLSGDASDVSRGALDWDTFVHRWGHLRPGTYELTSPRYDADAARFLRPLVDAVPARSRDIDRGAWVRERDPFLVAMERFDLGRSGDDLERTLRRAIEGREWAKLAFTRNLSDALEALAAGWGARGLGRDVISDAPLGLLLPDEHGQVADVALVAERAAAGRERRLVAESLPLAPLLTAQGDLDASLLTPGTPNFIGTQPVIAAVRELVGDEGSAEGLEGHIVLVQRADPGYDWLFGHGIAGLITLYGGANSHMAIRAAEHGLPAAIGVGEQRYRALRAATAVELDPRGRTLRALH